MELGKWMGCGAVLIAVFLAGCCSSGDHGDQTLDPNRGESPSAQERQVREQKEALGVRLKQLDLQIEKWWVQSAVVERHLLEGDGEAAKVAWADASRTAADIEATYAQAQGLDRAMGGTGDATAAVARRLQDMRARSQDLAEKLAPESR